MLGGGAGGLLDMRVCPQAPPHMLTPEACSLTVFFNGSQLTPPLKSQQHGTGDPSTERVTSGWGLRCPCVELTRVTQRSLLTQLAPCNTLSSCRLSG